MGKGDRTPRRGPDAEKVPEKLPRGGGTAVETEGNGLPRRWTTAAALGGALLAFVWILLCLRAFGHDRAGKAAAGRGQYLEAARKYESAVACYAPLNPFSRASAERMLRLAGEVRESDPALAEEILDRLRRTVRSVRWLRQPYADILSRAEGGGVIAAPRDPNAILFLPSLLALAAALGIWWLPVGRRTQLASSAAGLLAWGLLLYLC